MQYLEREIRLYLESEEKAAQSHGKWGEGSTWKVGDVCTWRVGRRL
jgi:hypothetical protein